MLKVGVIGAGFIGNCHAQAWQNVNNAKLLKIADIEELKAKKVAQQYNIEYTSNPEDLINDKNLDIVDVCLPTDLHQEFVIKGAKAKKHIFCEKPLARTIEDGKKMIDICRENKVKFMVGHVLRFFPEYSLIKQQIDAGIVGKPGIIRVSRLNVFPVSETGKNWYGNFERSGGVIFDMAIHDLDYLRWCFGEPERIFAKGLGFTEKYQQGIDYALIVIRFKSKIIVHLEASWAEPPQNGFNQEIEISGSKGLIHYNMKEISPLIVSLKQTSSQSAGVNIPESPLKQNPYSLELQEFINSIIENREPTPTPDDSLKTLQLALNILESVKKGEIINL